MLDLEALTWLRSAERSGLPVILSSARGKLELMMLSGFIGTTGPVIAENGGIIWYRSTREEKILGDLKKVREAYKIISTHISDLQLVLEKYRETDVMILGKRAAEMAPIIEFEKLDVHLLESKFATHITDSSASKAIGLRIASEMIDLAPSQVAAIGDAQNDVALFEAAGAGYAVGNADQRLRDIATKVMNKPNGKGCTDAIKEILRDHLAE